MDNVGIIVLVISIIFLVFAIFIKPTNKHKDMLVK